MAIWYSDSNCPSVTAHLSPFLNIRIRIGRALNEGHVLNDILQSAFTVYPFSLMKTRRGVQVNLNDY